MAACSWSCSSPARWRSSRWAGSSFRIRLLKGALEAYQHHRPGDALKRSRRCLALRPLPPLRPIAFQVCGLAHSALGAVSEAERCFRAALESPSPGVQARSAVLLAGLAHRDGRLKEARELLLRGREDPSTRRDACVGLVELLINEGDFDRARMELKGAQTTLALPDPGRELESQGLLRFLGALLEIEESRPAAAKRLLEEASGALAKVPLLALRLDVARAVVGALEHPASALAALKAADARLAECGEDRTSRLASEMLLARGYVLAGAHPDAERVLGAVLASDPPRIVLPEVHVLLAECASARGDPESSERSLREAVRAGVETRFASLARQRLSGVGCEAS
ncbi:MAG: tetratricopeptide repeat protein [Myxococcales bacterium]